MFQNNRLLTYFYWLLLTLLTILCLYLLMKLLPLYGVVFKFILKLFSPFLIAIFIAYLLYPIMIKLQSHNIHKVYAIIFIYLIFLGGFAYIIYIGYPAVINQLGELTEHLPHLITMYEDLIRNLYESTSFLPEAFHNKLDQLILRSENSLEDIAGKMIDHVTKVFDYVVIITVIPVLVFYILKDYDQIKRYLNRVIPFKFHVKIIELIKSVDDRLGGYIKGQLIVGLFVSLTTLIAFQIMKIDYALLLAIVMGLTNIIPYFGPIIGSIPAIMIALTISTKKVVFVIITVFVIQLIESNLLSPFIVGKSINIHPIAIIFALLIGGQLAGVVGMIIAVPLLTILKEVFTYFLAFKRYD